MCDYLLGGKDNFAADREAAEQAVAAYPPILRAVRAQRAFLVRAVRYLAEQAGMRQFLDIGTGLPTASNTHEVAQAAASDARVVYVDNDRCKSGCAHVVLHGPRLPEANTGAEAPKRRCALAADFFDAYRSDTAELNFRRLTVPVSYFCDLDYFGYDQRIRGFDIRSPTITAYWRCG